jgi:hypothetical protein
VKPYKKQQEELRERTIQNGQFFHQSSKTLLPSVVLNCQELGDYGTFEGSFVKKQKHKELKT